MPGSVLAEGDAPARARPRKHSNEPCESAVRLCFESNRPRMLRRAWGIHKEGCGSACARLRLIVASTTRSGCTQRSATAHQPTNEKD